MARARRRSRVKRGGFAEHERRWAFGEELDIGGRGWLFTAPESRLGEVWEAFRDEVVARWVAVHPGTRPPLWWEREAPLWPETVEPPPGWHAGLRLPRARRGGTGTPACDVLAYGRAYVRGIESTWLTPWMVDYYSGRATNVDGIPIGLEFADREFPYTALDPADPPAYDSEATYLRALDLLRAGEEERVPADGWEPELVRDSGVDRVTAYAWGVVSGATIAGPHVRNACARHLRDLLNGGARGFAWAG